MMRVTDVGILLILNSKITMADQIKAFFDYAEYSDISCLSFMSYGRAVLYFKPFQCFYITNALSI